MTIAENIFHFINCHNLKIKLVEKLVTSTEYELIEMTKIFNLKLHVEFCLLKCPLNINKARLDVNYF